MGIKIKNRIIETLKESEKALRETEKSPYVVFLGGVEK